MTPSISSRIFFTWKGISQIAPPARTGFRIWPQCTMSHAPSSRQATVLTWQHHRAKPFQQSSNTRFGHFNVVRIIPVTSVAPPRTQKSWARSPSCHHACARRHTVHIYPNHAEQMGNEALSNYPMGESTVWRTVAHCLKLPKWNRREHPSKLGPRAGLLCSTVRPSSI